MCSLPGYCDGNMGIGSLQQGMGMTAITLIRGKYHPRCPPFPMSPPDGRGGSYSVDLRGTIPTPMLGYNIEDQQFPSSSPVAACLYLIEAIGPRWSSINHDGLIPIWAGAVPTDPCGLTNAGMVPGDSRVVNPVVNAFASTKPQPGKIEKRRRSVQVTGHVTKYNYHSIYQNSHCLLT